MVSYFVVAIKLIHSYEKLLYQECWKTVDYLRSTLNKNVQKRVLGLAWQKRKQLHGENFRTGVSEANLLTTTRDQHKAFPYGISCYNNAC